MISQLRIRGFAELRCEQSKESDDQLLQVARAGDGQVFVALSSRY